MSDRPGQDPKTNQNLPIAVKEGERELLLEQGDLFRVYESEEGGVRVETRSDGYRSDQTLEELERTLDPALFTRISSDEIANLLKVFCFDVTISGDIRVLYQNGTESYLERSFLSAVQEKITFGQKGARSKKGKKRPKGGRA